jgi:hypothetical protein
MMKHTLLLLALLVGADRIAAQDPIKVPFDTLKSRHMVVDVYINDKGPYKLIFDTGAPATLISQKLAKETGVIRVKGKSAAAFFGNLGQQKIKSLKLGALAVSNIDAMVIDHPTVEAIAAAHKEQIDGIIGFNIFGRYNVSIDYQAKELTFAPGTFVPVEMMEMMMALMFPSLNEIERVPVLHPKGLLGLRVEKAKDDDAGVVVREVYVGSPAAKAGVKVGDRLLTIERRWTDSVNDCYEAARDFRPGRDAELEIRREGKKQVVKVRVAAGF